MSGRWEALRALLSASTTITPPADLAAWSQGWEELVAGDHGPVALALHGGFAADRVGWAFAAGYQAALRRLLANFGLAPDAAIRLALCATEEGGNRPRDIATALRADGAGWRLNGGKSWITLGPVCSELLVVARLDQGGEPSAPPTLKVARVPADAPGVRLRDKAPLAFVPEIPHTAATFEAVALPENALLDGDGYDTVVKPFRTVEDTFIALAVQAWLLREARARNWPADFAEALTASLVTLAALSDRPADDPVTHLALAGALARTQALYQDADRLWDGEGDEAAERWRRDRPLFQVAGKARALRAQRAWEQL
ncbi:acyl-CoA dehydrogenase family protein [Alloalcanivorax sp. C16-2]|uniref:acyl-CoA dehydrogenase family protein n=1 Tax=Alloalcanivorax sp. C16-2 TaxID=3390052 RepID=UPI003970CF18